MNCGFGVIMISRYSPSILTNVQTYLRDIVGLVPDHCNKADVVIKGVTHIFFLFPVHVKVIFTLLYCSLVGLPRWLSGNLPANAGDAGSIPGLGRSPGEGNGNPLQYSCLENPMDRGN